MKTISIIIPFCISILGGIFFGLFSCGGYVWWGTAYKILFAFALIPFVVFGLLDLKKEYSKQKLLKLIYSVTGILLISFLCFEVVQAGAAQFYPSAPESFGEWLSGFKSQLFGPPC